MPVSWSDKPAGQTRDPTRYPGVAGRRRTAAAAVDVAAVAAGLPWSGEEEAAVVEAQEDGVAAAAAGDGDVGGNGDAEGERADSPE